MTAPSATTSDDGTATTTGDVGFEEATAGFRRELLAHCYRMTGSPQRGRGPGAGDLPAGLALVRLLRGPPSLRTWLHRIATNVCLTALEGQQRRPLPTGLGAPSTTAAEPLVERGEVPWLGPLPDAMLGPTDPAEAVVEQDAVRLAFVAALQHLPARQRAVLVLRDVLRWSAAEVAEALETTVPAVNSALQRAHASLAQAAPDRERASVEPTSTPQQRATLEAYVDAFWRKDVASIARLLTEDAVWEMPPFTGWYRGRRPIAALIDTHCPGGAHDMPMLPTTSNGQPAFGLYLRERSDTSSDTGVPDTGRAPPATAVVAVPPLPVAGARARRRPGRRTSSSSSTLDNFARAGLPAELSGDDVQALAGA